MAIQIEHSRNNKLCVMAQNSHIDGCYAAENEYDAVDLDAQDDGDPLLSDVSNAGVVDYSDVDDASAGLDARFAALEQWRNEKLKLSTKSMFNVSICCNLD